MFAASLKHFFGVVKHSLKTGLSESRKVFVLHLVGVVAFCFNQDLFLMTAFPVACISSASCSYTTLCFVEPFAVFTITCGTQLLVDVASPSPSMCPLAHDLVL